MERGLGEASARSNGLAPSTVAPLLWLQAVVTGYLTGDPPSAGRMTGGRHHGAQTRAKTRPLESLALHAMSQAADFHGEPILCGTPIYSAYLYTRSIGQPAPLAILVKPAVRGFSSSFSTHDSTAV